MLARCLALALQFALAFTALFAQHARAFFDPPWITPAHPKPGEEVSVNIRGGICDDIDNVQSITRNGNQIRILFFGVRYEDPEMCNIPVGQAPFSVGTFPPGSYVLQVDLMYYRIVGPPQIDTLGIVPFRVQIPGSAIPAPVNTLVILVILGLALMSLALWKLGARSLLLLPIGIFALSSTARAQDTPDSPAIQLLLSMAPGAPTPDDVVNYFRRSPRSGQPPLQSLAVGNPQQVEYLMSVRAQGDFLTWLQANPDSPRAALERYIVVLYPPGTDTAPALKSLLADPYVASAYVPLNLRPSAASLISFDVTQSRSSQYGRDDLNIDDAWRITGGWALVSAIDYGLYEKHSALRQFSDTNQYLGGNFISIASLDVGRTALLPPDNGPDYASVDEARPLDNSDPSCGGDQTPAISVGHGTHTAGLIAANGASGQGVQGTCKHCGLTEWKVSYTKCRPLTHDVSLRWNPRATSRALTSAIDVGAQVISMSFGGAAPADFCFAQLHPPVLTPEPMCLALDYASGRAVAMVASSGNDRTDLNFPASEPEVISAGGFQESLSLWDESPGGTSHCPVASFLDTGQECGSNFTLQRPHAQQEVVASAHAVLSTTYPGRIYADYARCGDQYQPTGMAWGNGVGLCTGTSMSAPQISGVVGLLRSIDPLMRVGLPTDTSIPSVRGILASTTFEAQAGQGWTSIYGRGRPDAAAAARKMLGGAVGTRNRVTPLFRLYSSAQRDYADVTSPQYALALMINQTSAWRPVASLPTVPGYSEFPHGPNETLPGSPRASVYVMTTEVRPRDDGPALLPLYLMSRDDGNAPFKQDFMLVTSKAEIEQAHGGTYKYNLRNIQGYIYAPCTNESGCKPEGTTKLWRKFNTTTEDCATFTDNERPDFESRGYTAACPAGPTTMLGYVYSSIAPCPDGTGTLPCRGDSLFRNGFEVL